MVKDGCRFCNHTGCDDCMEDTRALKYAVNISRNFRKQLEEYKAKKKQ